MKTATLPILLAAGAALALPAHAQTPATPPPSPAPQSYSMAPLVSQPADPGWDQDAWRRSHVDGFNGIPAANPFWAGFMALNARDFARAETFFARAVRRYPIRDDAEASLYLGAVRMELGKWADAKEPLEFAARKIPEHPDPKSRLGVTYAMLGDIAGANAQRAALVTMAERCGKTCEHSPYIGDGIEMIDEALGTR